jgi:hypothetical protein
MKEDILKETKKCRIEMDKFYSDYKLKLKKKINLDMEISKKFNDFSSKI